MHYLSMTFAASLMILCILLIRKYLVYRIPSLVFTLLWGLVLVRLCMPYKIETTYNLYNLLYYLYFLIQEQMVDIFPMPLENYFFAFCQNHMVQMVCFVVWLIGAICFCCYFANSYRLIRKIQKEAMPLVEEQALLQSLQTFGLKKEYALREMYDISSPLSCGVIRPMIVLPKGFSRQNPELLLPSLLHEYMHLTYHHPLIQYLLTILCILNWYNPCIWLLYKYINQDMEIACDRGALKHIGAEYKERYALHLVQFAEQMAKQTTEKTILYHGYTKGILKERVIAIMKFQKLSIMTIMISTLLPIGFASALSTNDKYVLGYELVHGLDDMRIVSVEVPTSEQVAETDIFVPWETLAQYVDTQDERNIPKQIPISNYSREYPKGTSIPSAISVTTKRYGTTYKGTLELSDTSTTKTKIIAYYSGILYRQ